ncbi:MAG: hypothetical protein FWD62_10415 [Betaproteobacteria bacterium]|nr:hypothetical protein [Betaproteobacteria bacterium]
MSAHPPSLRSVPATQVFRWVMAGWRLFIRKPLEWVLMAFVTFLLLAFTGALPFFGRILAMIILQVLAGSMVAAAHHLHERDDLHISEVFDGFRQHAGNLAMVGLLFGLALTLAGIATFAITLLTNAIAHFFAGLPLRIDMLIESLFADWLVSAAVTVALLLTLWFAPALVMLDARPPFEAMRLSLRACIHNASASLLLALLLSIVVPLFLTLTFGFGILVLIPLISTTIYASYRDVFELDPPTDSPAD